MQAGYTKKTNHVIRGLRLWAMIYQLDFHGVERSWRLRLISGQWFNQLRLYNEIQIKTPDSTVQWVSLVGNTLCVLLHNDVPGGWHVMISEGGNTSFTSESLQDLALWISSFGWFCFVPFLLQKNCNHKCWHKKKKVASSTYEYLVTLK